MRCFGAVPARMDWRLFRTGCERRVDLLDPRSRYVAATVMPRHVPTPPEKDMSAFREVENFTMSKKFVDGAEIAYSIGP